MLDQPNANLKIRVEGRKLQRFQDPRFVLFRNLNKLLLLSFVQQWSNQNDAKRSVAFSCMVYTRDMSVSIQIACNLFKCELMKQFVSHSVLNGSISHKSRNGCRKYEWGRIRNEAVFNKVIINDNTGILRHCLSLAWLNVMLPYFSLCLVNVGSTLTRESPLCIVGPACCACDGEVIFDLMTRSREGWAQSVNACQIHHCTADLDVFINVQQMMRCRNMSIDQETFLSIERFQRLFPRLRASDGGRFFFTEALPWLLCASQNISCASPVNPMEVKHTQPHTHTHTHTRTHARACYLHTGPTLVFTDYKKPVFFLWTKASELHNLLSPSSKQLPSCSRQLESFYFGRVIGRFLLMPLLNLSSTGQSDKRHKGALTYPWRAELRTSIPERTLNHSDTCSESSGM